MRIILFTIILALGSLQLHSQVILDTYLQEDHKGKLVKSKFFDGEPMNYKFKFVSVEKGVEYQSAQSIQKINYKLQLGNDEQRMTFNVLIRDLIVTTYFEIDLDNGPDAQVISGIYNKRNRWIKMKGVLEEGCKYADEVWSRLDQVEDFDQLLKFIVRDIDKNVDLSCFAQ